MPFSEAHSRKFAITPKMAHDLLNHAFGKGGWLIHSASESKFVIQDPREQMGATLFVGLPVSGVKLDVHIDQIEGGVMIWPEPSPWQGFKARNNSGALGHMGKVCAQIDEAYREFTAPKAQQSSVSIADEIIKLEELKNRGVLSDDEFREAKQKLIHA